MSIQYISKLLLVRRIETLKNALHTENKLRFEKVMKDTLETIEKTPQRDTDIHEADLAIYVKNLDMALIMFYLDVSVDIPSSYLELAIDAIERDLATMTPSYILLNRMLCDKKDHKNTCGNLSDLPNDIRYHISTLILAK